MPGLPVEKESGLVERMSLVGMDNEIESNDNRENIVLRVSKRGRITVSR